MKLVAKLATVGGIVLIGSAAAWWFITPHAPTHACNFRDDLRSQATTIGLYCFDQNALPKDVISYPEKAIKRESAVLFVLTDGATSLSVSLQKKPDDTQISKFITGVIPLYFEVATPVGPAKTGISGEQSISSLPTDSTWILVTAPKDYNPDRLTKILQAVHKD